MDDIDFARDVAQVVEAIPSGKVLTYGDVAALAGRPGCARQVGRILGCFGFDSAVPCHRVVNKSGRTAPHWPRQVDLLKAEGVAFNGALHVDMPRHHWHPELDWGHW